VSVNLLGQIYLFGYLGIVTVRKFRSVRFSFFFGFGRSERPMGSTNAEILWTLKSVYNNFSFASNEGCNQLLGEMVPDSVIAKVSVCVYMVK
jgi:hypothetical protein